METPSVPTSPAKVTTSVLKPESAVPVEASTGSGPAVRNGFGFPKSAGYGLPCSQCHLYYPATLDSCPTCKNKERVSPTGSPADPSAQAVTQAAPDSSLIEPERLEKEREEFLEQFKSQLLETREEVVSTPPVCTLGVHHHKGEAAASICKPCYDRLQERVDVFEAALHMDLKEAAQIVYDAVWADPSEPSKTYANAASALLTELRKRSGVATVLGPFHPMGN